MERCCVYSEKMKQAFQAVVAFVIVCQSSVIASNSRRLTSAKSGIALSLLAGHALGCNRGVQCMQECNVCDQVAFTFDGEKSALELFEMKGINLSEMGLPHPPNKEVKGLVRDVLEDGRCLVQLSAKSAKAVGLEAAVLGPEHLWRDYSTADFAVKAKFLDKRISLLVAAAMSGTNRKPNPKPNQKWCFNSGRNQ